MSFQDAVQVIGKILDGAGSAVVVVGVLVASTLAILGLRRGQGDVYVTYRRSLGSSILLGLEFLVAADIIRTVAITPTVESVSVLAGIVLIRTVLSFSLEVEISGRWPWQEARQS